jgi:hypothetical protein
VGARLLRAVLPRDEDDKIEGPSKIKGLVRQQAFKKLKGGEGAARRPDGEHASQLVAPDLRLAREPGRGAVLKAAESRWRRKRRGPCRRWPKGATYAMVTAASGHFVVDDPFVLDAMSAIESPGFKGLPMEVMGKFKHYLTMGVTASPVVPDPQPDSRHDRRHRPERDELQRAENVAQGFKGTNERPSDYAQMLFGGALMRFGTYLEDKHAEHAKRLIAEGVDDATILTNPRR